MSVDVQWANFWISFALALITFFAVGVALFGQRFWDWKNKPMVKVGFGNDEPYVITTYLNKEINQLFRLKIVNQGKTVAKNCRVRILSVFPENGVAKDSLIDEPDILKWSSAPQGTRYHVDANPIYREFKHITPENGWEFCDFFEFTSSIEKKVVFSSSGRRNFVAENEKYIATIEISGDNLKPTRKQIRLCFPFKVDWSNPTNPAFILAGIKEIRNISQ